VLKWQGYARNVNTISAVDEVEEEEEVDLIKITFFYLFHSGPSH
jgi:hypothetical protein